MSKQHNALIQCGFNAVITSIHGWSNIDKLPFISAYNQFDNILRLFDVLPIFPFTTSKTMGDYYL